VNRLLTEGRQAFLRRVSGIERGVECARYEPLLSALADGEASAEQLALLRPHMRTCLSCRARLREFRAAPERVASVIPPAGLVVSGGGTLRNVLESLVGATQQKTAAMGDRLHAAAELATGQKLAAVAASAAALAGGGTAIDQLANHRGPPQPAQVRNEQAHAPDAQPRAPTPAPPPPDQSPAAGPELPEGGASAPPAPKPSPPPPDPATEFAPTGSAQASSGSPPAPPPQRAGIDFAGGGGSGGEGSSGAGSGEFAP
jgi:hypothetical protein